MNEITTWEEMCDFAFFALQLIDKATLFSKKEVLEEYEKHEDDRNIVKLLLKKSIYPNGGELGFYNNSKNTLANILYKKEIGNADWYIIKEKFESEYQFLNDIEKEKAFEEWLGENFSTEYFNFRDFERELAGEFIEYLNGFSENVRYLINVIPNIFDGLFYKVKSNLNKGIPIDSMDNINDIANNKDDLYYFILDCIENFLELDDKYINYYDLRDFLLDVLFEGIEIKQNTTILHILPETPFIFSCLDYMKNKNPECQAHVYIITPSVYMYFLLELLNTIKSFGIIDSFNDFDGNDLSYIYYDLFNECKQFDFIIQSNFSEFDLIDKGYNISQYNFQVSSRVMYINKFNHASKFNHATIYDDWLKEDLLESLILIPFENTIQYTPFDEEDIFKLALVTTLNYNKSQKQKNKFLGVDKNLNYDITSKKHSLEDFRNIVKNNEIYGGSLRLFSEFVDSENSKIFDIENFMGESNYNWHHRIVDFNFNDELYDVKMKSQKKYFEIGFIEEKKRITKNLDYPIVKLGSLVNEITDYDIEESKINTEENSFYMKEDMEYADKIVFFNFEIGDIAHYISFKVVSENVDLQYLYYYLNSELGRNEYYYHLRGHTNFNDDVLNIRVPIPPKEDQDSIVEAMNKSNDFFNDIKQLKNTINKNFFNYEQNFKVLEEFYGDRLYSEETQVISMPDNWIYTYSGLVWPLAITYLIATSGGFEKVEKANNLLRLFEFTTAFNAIVLISGIPDEIYEKHKDKIWRKAHDKDNYEEFVDFYKLSFGSWVTFHYKLRDKIYSKKFDTALNKEFYLKLLNSDIIGDYNTLKNQRNKEFHDGITNVYEAESLIKELEIPKAKVFNYLNDCYNNFRLYYTTGRMDTKTKEHEVIFLNGPYSMPIYSTVVFNGMLEPEQLYLYDIVENKMTKLNDRLIKFIPIDEMKHEWRLYIFIGFENDENKNKKAIYKCYQRKEDELEEYFDLNELM